MTQPCKDDGIGSLIGKDGSGGFIGNLPSLSDLCAPVQISLDVAPSSNGGWDLTGGVHQAALIAADVIANVDPKGADGTLDVTAGVLQCEIVDVHLGVDLFNDCA